MTDTSIITAAAARVETDATIINRTAGEVRRIAREVRSRHPAGAVAIDGELAAGLAAASAHQAGSGAQLLEVERLHRTFTKREVEAQAEDRRRAEADMRWSIENRAALMAGSHVGRPPRDPDVLEAARVLRMRVDGIAWNLASATSEAGFAAMLDDMEAAAKSFTGSLGIARRASRLRRSAEMAAQAAAVVAEAA